MVTCYRLEQGKCFLGYTDKRFFCKCQSGIENVGVTGWGEFRSKVLSWELSSALRSSSLPFCIFFLREKAPPSLKQYLPLTNGTPFKCLV